MSVLETKAHFTRWIVPSIPKGSRVLDLGCGDGSLLFLLKKYRNITGYGIDIDPNMILECIKKRISIVQGDIDKGLLEYPSGSYDFVILSRTLQACKNPKMVLREMVRVGKHGIVLFNNLGYLPVRMQVFGTGTIPFSNGNLRHCSCRSFKDLCRAVKIQIVSEISFLGRKKIPNFLSNILGDEAGYIVRANNAGNRHK
jgi:methionine biosynthesis protein MetW